MTRRGVSLWAVGEMCPIPLPVMGLGMSMGCVAVPANEMPGKVFVGVEGWRGSSGKVCLALKKEHKEGTPWRFSGEDSTFLLPRAWAQSPEGEISSHKPHGVAKRGVGHKEGRPLSPSLWTLLDEVPTLPPSCLINMLKMAEQKERRTRTPSHQITQAWHCPASGLLSHKEHPMGSPIQHPAHPHHALLSPTSTPRLPSSPSSVFMTPSAQLGLPV